MNKEVMLLEGFFIVLGAERMKKVLILFLLPLLLFYSMPGQAADIEERDFQEEMIYSIMIDRFNNGDPLNDYEVNTSDPYAYHGGDIVGVTKRLDYIKDMGFTTILLSPIFQSASFDGQQIVDYFEMEEHFGTIDTFKELINQAHQRDLNIMIDFVSTDVIGSEELLEAGIWWANETGLDGYRLRNMESQPLAFWTEFISKIKDNNETFILIGDIDLGDELNHDEIGIDFFMDHSFLQQAQHALSKPDQPLEQLYEVDGSIKYFDDQDTVRFTRLSLENKEHPVTRLKIALSYLYLTPGVPFIYYGTEIVQDGGDPPINSPLMNFRTDDELVSFISKLSKMRTTIPALSLGTFEVLHSTDDGFLVGKRSYEGESFIIVINNSTKTQKFTIPSNDFEGEIQLRGLFDDEVIKDQNQNYSIILDREKAEVYQLEQVMGINIPFIIMIIFVPLAMVGFFYVNRKKHQHKE